jgi:thymidylate synthase ThyX
MGSGISETEHIELTKVIETLVDDNDALKRDNAELQNFLADTREELRAVQEEFEEYRLNPPVMARAGKLPYEVRLWQSFSHYYSLVSPHLRQHHYRTSMPASTLKEMVIFMFRTLRLLIHPSRWAHSPVEK